MGGDDMAVPDIPVVASAHTTPGAVPIRQASSGLPHQPTRGPDQLSVKRDGPTVDPDLYLVGCPDASDTPARPITVVLIDDHEIVDEGVRGWCAQADPPIMVVDSGRTEIVAWTGAGAEADVVVLDLLLRGDRPDLTVLQRLVEANRNVVVFTQLVNQATACIRLGAMAHVTKLEGRAHLVQAIQLAAQGCPHTPPALGGAMLVDDTPDRPELTAAEVDALRAWFIAGSKELAAQRLGKTPRAVDKLIEKARLRYALVGRPAPTQAMLLARALQDGLITIAEMDELGPAGSSA